MKYIVDGKLLDTDKAELVLRYSESNMMLKRECELYKTNNGGWYKVDISFSNRNYEINRTINACKRIKENDAKEILERANCVNAYEKYFGKLEEA